jgi:hypothetical protein
MQEPLPFILRERCCRLCALFGRPFFNPHPLADADRWTAKGGFTQFITPSGNGICGHRYASAIAAAVLRAKRGTVNISANAAAIAIAMAPATCPQLSGRATPQ